MPQDINKVVDIFNKSNGIRNFAEEMNLSYHMSVLWAATMRRLGFRLKKWEMGCHKTRFDPEPSICKECGHVRFEKFGDKQKSV